MSKRIVYIFIIFIPFIFACKKNTHPSWDVDLLTPLANASLGINNLVNDTMMHINDDKSISLIYSNKFYEVALDSLFKIPDTNVVKTYKIPFIITNVQPGTQIVSLADNINFNVDNATLTKAIIRSGTIKVTLTSRIKEKLVCEYKVPYAKKNGNVFTISVNVPAATTASPGHVVKSFDLSGYTIDLRGSTLGTANTISTSTKVWVDSTGNPVTIVPQDSLIIENSFVKIVPEYAKGYFGTENVSIAPNETPFDFLKHIVGGTFNLADIKFTLELNNGFGLDATAILKQLASINSKTNVQVNLNDPIIGKSINITRASETGNVIHPVAYTYYSININGQNAKKLLENLPDKIRYALDLHVNPLGNVSGGNDFLYYGKGLKASLNMEIPLTISLKDLVMIDTVDFHIDRTNEANNFENGQLIVYADNYFPLESTIQLYLLNDNLQIMDSIFTLNTVDAAFAEGGIKVINSKKSLLKIEVTKEKINKVYAAKKIKIVARFNTYPTSQYLKIYDDYRLNLKLVADFSYRVHQ